MAKMKKKEIKIIFGILCAVFLIFLAAPMVQLLLKSFVKDGSIGAGNFREMFGQKGFLQALGNSFLVSCTSALVTTLLAFIMAYGVHYTNLGRKYKKLIQTVAVLPMLLPTITYGFAIIYSFGKQGLLTRIFGHQLFEIYGFNGLLLGYVIYTLPVSFMLLNNTMGYIDKKYMVVSRIMNDTPWQTFLVTVFWPMLGTFAASFIQTFFLCFTDFGIPASVGGEFQVIASVLYSEMLGSAPDFGNGAVVALVMLIPSVVSIAVLKWLEKYNVRYNKISAVELKKSPARDCVFALLTGIIMICVISVFAVIFVVPFVKDWPYYTNFTLEHIRTVFSDSSLYGVYLNSLMVALLTAVIGTLISYGAALITARSSISPKWKNIVEGIALVTNTIPGMVLGLAYLFAFSGSFLQNTFAILIICNMVHFFSTPYLMMKSSLAKMNASWETTAMLMGDTWTKTVVRVVTPNALSTLLEVFSYYFVNAMVTISAVIFLAGARTMVITTKIKELQYYNKFNEIFVLSLLILFTNLAAKAVFGSLARRAEKRTGAALAKPVGKLKRVLAGLVIVAVMAGGITTFTVAGAQGNEGEEKVVIYSNADDEAVECMKAALDENGYKGQYILQTFGTSELGGKLLAEGENIEADLITMSTFYVDSAQKEQKMFLDLTFEVNTLDECPSYCAPITAQEGTILVNTQMMKENNLPMPASLKDLADPVYKDTVSVTDISSSSTAWLLLQALVSEYGEEGAKEVLTGIYENAGPHIEESGSGPLKKVRAGEVAVGFGLRQQAVADKEKGLPVDFVDPAEGNFSLTESVAVVDKQEKTNEKAMDMARCIIEKGREKLLEYYPNALYAGETTDSANQSANPKVFEEPLTVELLERHQALSESCK